MRKSNFKVEKRIADENFIFTAPGLYYAIGDEYFVLIEHVKIFDEDNDILLHDFSIIVGWAHTEKSAWSLRY